MRVQQITLSTESPIADALAPARALEPQLVLTFADPAFFETPGIDLARALSDAFPGAMVIGCSSAGEISNDGVDTGSAVVTAIRFERPGLAMAREPIADMSDSELAGERLGRQLAGGHPHTVIVFGQGVELNGSALIRGLRSSLGDSVTIVGGLAGDAGRFVRTFVIAGAEAPTHEIVGVAFKDAGLRVTTGTFGGWKPFGALRRITRADGNVLHELDGEPALNVYRRYLGEHARGLPGSALLFPFSMVDADGRETGVIRTILGMDETTGSLTLAGEITANGFLRLMTASSDELIDGAEVAAEAVADQGSDSAQSFALLVSCVGRRMVLGARVDEEVEAVGSVVGRHCALAGFYSNGEISSNGELLSCGAGNHLHNQTMTITRFIEA